MKTNHVLEQLSAYIDGEAVEPDAIARHLQQCEACARRHMELSKLSAHIKALPQPQTHPAFLTRVMAEVNETRPIPWWAGRPFGWMSTIVATGLAAVIILTFFRGTPGPPTNVLTRHEPPAKVDENALMTRIAERLAEGAYTPILEANDDSDEGAPSLETPDTADEVMTIPDTNLFAHLDWTDDATDDAYPDLGIDGALDGLDDSETQIFTTLLGEYAGKG